MKRLIAVVCAWLCFIFFAFAETKTAEEKIPAKEETKDAAKEAAEKDDKEDVDATVKHLIKFVRESECTFERNGEWHSAEEAAVHLKSKYDYGKKRNAIKTPEDFISKCATGSSFTGEKYTVKTKDGDMVASADFLLAELKRYREKK